MINIRMLNVTMTILEVLQCMCPFTILFTFIFIFARGLKKEKTGLFEGKFRIDE